jgi:hypothetical protein
VTDETPSPLTWRDIAVILAMIDGQPRGRVTLTQGNMSVTVDTSSPLAPPSDQET